MRVYKPPRALYAKATHTFICSLAVCNIEEKTMNPSLIDTSAAVARFATFALYSAFALGVMV